MDSVCKIKQVINGYGTINAILMELRWCSMLKIQDLQNGVICDVTAEYGLIRATGTEARTFLHAQLTQDVLGLSDTDTKLGGYCSAKGRLYAIFQLYAQGENVYLLTHRSVVEPVLKRLRMFVLRAKVQLLDVSDTHTIMGFCGASALSTGVRSGDATQIRLGVLPAIIDGQNVARELRLIALEHGNTPEVQPEMQVAAVWQWLDIMAGLPHVETATYEAFVPQMVNLDRIGGVNFKKGCYPGQEIVARSHYLGKLKRRMILACTDTLPVDLPIGADVLVGGEVAGQMVAFAADPIHESRAQALFEVSLPMLEGEHELHVQGSEAAWQTVDLPYSLND